MAAATIIHDTTIVTVDDGDTIAREAALVVEDGRIAAVGPDVEVPEGAILVEHRGTASAGLVYAPNAPVSFSRSSG